MAQGEQRTNGGAGRGCKVSPPNMACLVIDWAIQAFGGAGVTADYGLASAYAKTRLLRISIRPDEVHRSQIARLELKPPDNTLGTCVGNALLAPLDEPPGLARRPRFITRD